MTDFLAALLAKFAAALLEILLFAWDGRCSPRPPPGRQLELHRRAGPPSSSDVQRWYALAELGSLGTLGDQLALRP
jgi:hypothetical protein